MPILMSNPPKGTDGGLIDVFTEMNMKEAEAHLNRYGTVHANLASLGKDNSVINFRYMGSCGKQTFILRR